VTRSDICVGGGGLLGRCLAWCASKASAHVALYDAASNKGEGSAAWVAGGMIAPTFEALEACAQVGSQTESRGRRSLAPWPPGRNGWRSSRCRCFIATVELCWSDRENVGEAIRVQRTFAWRRLEGHVERLEGTRGGELASLGRRLSEALSLPTRRKSTIANSCRPLPPLLSKARSSATGKRSSRRRLPRCRNRCGLPRHGREARLVEVARRSW
jgi:glycine/D-amino acid oxidase-like deaminating enzyme